MNNETLLKIIEWATGRDTGASSATLCRFMLGIDGINNVPFDADDRGRCIRLLNLIPEWWDRLDELANLPSKKVTVFGKGGINMEERGWRQQIPLIRKEAGRL